MKIMIANGMAIDSNFPLRIKPDTDKKSVNTVPEKTSTEISQVGEIIRENVKVNREVLQKSIDEINQNIRIFNTKLSFSVDEPTGKTVIKVSDRETEEVIRVIPPLEFLKIAAKLNEIIGMIIDKKA